MRDAIAMTEAEMITHSDRNAEPNYKITEANVIINGQKAAAIIDSASIYSIFSEAAWKYFKGGKLEPTKQQPTAAEGSHIHITGVGRYSGSKSERVRGHVSHL